MSFLCRNNPTMSLLERKQRSRKIEATIFLSSCRTLSGSVTEPDFTSYQANVEMKARVVLGVCSPYTAQYKKT